MKTIGVISLILGLAGTLFFGYQAIQDSESLNVLGLNIAVSKADWTPVIISDVVLVIGAVLTFRKKK